MLSVQQIRALYRTTWRDIGRLPGSVHRPQLLNLRRLFRSQLREALSDPIVDIGVFRAKAARTLRLLGSSARLTANLASLSYHHTPTPIRGTPNAARLAHLPKPIAWNPKDPSAAQKAWNKRQQEHLRDPVWRVSQSVDAGLRKVWREAEHEAGGVWLGKVERARSG